MTSEEQVNSNKENALKSTGPKDCSVTRFNATQFGLTGQCFLTPEETVVFEEVYEELVQSLEPQDSMEKFLISRMAQIIMRLQRINHLESATLQNSLISAENWKNDPIREMDKYSLTYNKNEKPLIVCESMTGIDLLIRYETTLENRLIKLLKVFFQKKDKFI